MGKTSKDKRDIYYRLAKEDGWRARSAYKLIQVDEQLNILPGVKRVVDLCAAPGSWSQVLSQRLPESEDRKIVAVDLQLMAPIPGVIQLQGDITKVETAERILKEFSGEKADLVVCDGAPDVTGLHDLDEYSQSHLLLAALSISTHILAPSGNFVAKIFRGSSVDLLYTRLTVFFDEVVCCKPRSSRNSSFEAFVVGKRFKQLANFDPKMLLLSTNRDLNNIRITEFVAAGSLDLPDSDKSYELPENYDSLAPIQEPTIPPYKDCVENRRNKTQ